MVRGRARAEETLEPVRGRPRRAVLARTALVAVLLVTAALVVWSGAGTAGGRRAASATAEGSGGRDPTGGAGRGSSGEPGGANTAGEPGGANTAGEHGGANTAGGHGGADAAGRPGGAGVSGGDVAPAGAGRDSRVPVPPGLVGVPVRLADPTALAVVGAGDRVDLLRIKDGGRTEPVAQSALVLAITGAGDPLAGGMLLALHPAVAKRAVASPEHGYAVLLRPD